MGRNPNVLSGVSWKIYKLHRKGTAVTMWWGPAKLVKRKVKERDTLQHQTKWFPSEAAAIDFEKKQVASKIARGYERRTRRK